MQYEQLSSPVRFLFCFCLFVCLFLMKTNVFIDKEKLWWQNCSLLRFKTGPKFPNGFQQHETSLCYCSKSNLIAMNLVKEDDHRLHHVFKGIHELVGK